MQMKNQIFSVLLFLGLSGCVDFADLSETQIPDYQAEFALPLINSQVSIKDLIDSDASINGLSVDADGTLRFRYLGSEIRRDGAELFQQVEEDFPPAFPVILPETRYPISEFSDIELERLDFKAGQLIYYFENPNLERVTVEFEFSSLLKDGEPLRITAELPPSNLTGPPSAATNSDGPIDLDGYRLVPDDNEIVLRYTAKNESGQDRPLTDFVVRFQNPAFSYVEGYLGQFAIEGVEDAVRIDFVEEYTGGSIQFADPKVILGVENSFGVPTRAQVNEFYVKDRNGSEQDVNSAQLDEGLLFPFPGLNEVGSVARKTFTFDKDNSNILDLFAGNPIRLIYDVDAIVNPQENEKPIGFITDSSFYALQLMVDLPLFGKVDDYILADTFDIDLSSFDEIEKATFKIIAENDLGIDARVQAYFLDEQGEVVEALFSERQLIAQAADVDSEGRSDSPRVTTTFVDADAVRSQRIRQASQLALEVGFSTETNAPRAIRIQEQQGVSVKIGALVTVRGN